MDSLVLVERRRADFIEGAHRGRLAIVDGSGALVAALGDVDAPFLPRSSCKIIQAIPMVESGAADAARLSPARLALACASHQGSDAHAAAAKEWLEEMGLGERDLMCGSQVSGDGPTRDRMRAESEAPSQLHNNCSGKHAGFLCQARHIGAPVADYIDPSHAVQRGVAQTTTELAEEELGGFAIDGCSAPNYAVSLSGLARAMSKIAAAETALSGARQTAAIRLREAMAANPFEVAGEGRCCTDLIRASGGRIVVKTGAEGSFTGILPELGLGIALKIDDGSTTAAETAMTSVLVALNALDRAEPRVTKWLSPQITNRRGAHCGEVHATSVIDEAAARAASK